MRFVPTLIHAIFVAVAFFTKAAGAASISLSGNSSYQISGPSVVMNADRVTNNATGGASGTLRMELWAFSSRYTGSSQSGYQLAAYTLGQLNGGQYFNSISSGTVSFSYPPNGTWYVSIIITEYNYGSWPTVDYGNVSTAMICSGGYCANAPTTTNSAPTTAADCLFTWAEANYSSLFSPRGAPSLTIVPYYYRHYSQTNAYLGTSSTDNHLYYIGALSSNSLLDLGSVASWHMQSGCVSTTPATPATAAEAPPSATALITSHMSLEYSAFVYPAVDLENQFAARGVGCASFYFTQLKDLKLSYVRRFVNDAAAYVRTMKNTGFRIDKPAILSLFNGYMTQDLAWLTSYGWGCPPSSDTLSELATTFVPAVDGAYSNAVAQINAM